MIGYLRKPANLFERFFDKFNRIKGWKIFSATVLFSILYNVVSAILLDIFFQIELKATVLNDLSFPAKFIIAVVAAPILETMIYQFLIIECIWRFLPKFRWLGLVLSTLLFAIAHSYSNAYIIVMIIPGLLLGTLYITFKIRGQHPFTMVCLAHVFINLYSLLHNSLN